MRKIKIESIRDIIKGNFDYYISRRFKHLPLKYLTINVTYRCNARCRMCNIWQYKRKNELSLKEIEVILQDPIFLSVENLAINGGEATLRRDVVDIVNISISKMKSLNSLTYNTNGLLTDRIINNVKQIAKLCSNKNIHFTVYVSLDGIGEIHDEVRGIDGAFEKSSKTIYELKKIKNAYNIGIGTACVLSNINIDHIADLEKWRREEGLGQGYILVGFHDNYVNNMNRLDDVGFNNKTSKAKLLKILKRLSEDKSLTNFSAYYWYDMYKMMTRGDSRKSICPLIVEGAAFDAYGDVYYCLSEPSIGNLKTDGSFSEIYYSQKAILARKKIMKERCPHCESGCMVDIGIRNNIFSYLKFLCFKNKFEVH